MKKGEIGTLKLDIDGLHSIHPGTHLARSMTRSKVLALEKARKHQAIYEVRSQSYGRVAECNRARTVLFRLGYYTSLEIVKLLYNNTMLPAPTPTLSLEVPFLNHVEHPFRFALGLCGFKAATVQPELQVCE